MSLREALAGQAVSTERMGSPFTGRLLRILSERLQPDSPLTKRLFDWQGDITATGDAVPLRLAGALHGLVLDGTSPGLAAVYPPNASSEDGLWQAVSDAIQTHQARINEWLDEAPQTNETARSGVLIAVAHWLADRFDQPLDLMELGASAGLNLWFDRYALDVDGARFGAVDPALTLSPKWEGGLPPRATPRFATRRGCDLNPLDPTDPADRLRLQAYIWADQEERLKRVRAAISLAQPVVDAYDAVSWLRAKLSDPNPGHLRLIYHTVAWQYFPEAAKTEARALIEDAGVTATQDTPLAWFGMEVDGKTPGAGLNLRVWPGNETHSMGRADFHGRWIKWAPERIG